MQSPFLSRLSSPNLSGSSSTLVTDKHEFPVSQAFSQGARDEHGQTPGAACTGGCWILTSCHLDVAQVPEAFVSYKCQVVMSPEHFESGVRTVQTTCPPFPRLTLSSGNISRSQGLAGRIRVRVSSVKMRPLGLERKKGNMLSLASFSRRKSRKMGKFSFWIHPVIVSTPNIISYPILSREKHSYPEVGDYSQSNALMTELGLELYPQFCDSVLVHLEFSI